MTFQTFTGKQYLAIDIANNFGLDKKNWDERLDWLNSVEDKLESLVPKAENPALFYAGVMAYRKAQAGIPSGYQVSLDGTASGMQILAALVGDRQAAKLCNVVDTGKREDSYTSIYEFMVEALGEAKKIARSDVKDAVMTALYSSLEVPKRVFGEGELLNLFYGTMHLMAPGVWALNESFIHMWDPEVSVYSWTLPDNFHVNTKVRGTTEEWINFRNAPEKIITKINAPTEKGRSLGANTTHSVDGYIVREMVRRCDYDKEKLMQVKTALCFFGEGDIETEEGKMVTILWNQFKRTGMLSARILDYINEDTVHLIEDRAEIWKLIRTLPLKPFKVTTVHDCFKCLPNYGNDLRATYARLLAEVAKGNLLNAILTEALRRDIHIEKIDPDLWMDIMDTNYALS